MIQAKQIVASFYHVLLLFCEAWKSARYPSGFAAVTYNAFNHIRVNTVYKYGMRKDAKMKLHVPVSGCLLLGCVCFGYRPARAQS